MRLIRDLDLRPDKNGKRSRFALFECECGALPVLVKAEGLSQKACRECANEQISVSHTEPGWSGTRLYNIWTYMVQRCARQNLASAKWGRRKGITVCEAWRTDFAAFRTFALSHGYTDELTIDRIDVNGDYCPENCQFVTPTQLGELNEHTT